MFAYLSRALQRRRTAIAEAETLVWQFGARGVELANGLACDETLPEEGRAHYRRVARIAGRRHRCLKNLDVAGQYKIWDRWRRRRGALPG